MAKKIAMTTCRPRPRIGMPVLPQDDTRRWRAAAEDCSGPVVVGQGLAAGRVVSLGRRSLCSARSNMGLETRGRERRVRPLPGGAIAALAVGGGHGVAGGALRLRESEQRPAVVRIGLEVLGVGLRGFARAT